MIQNRKAESLQNNSVRVLGIDPSLQQPGFAVLEAKKSSVVCLYSLAVKMPSKAKSVRLRGSYERESNRLLDISVNLSQILDRFRPRYIAMEAMPFGSRRLETLSMVVGALLLRLAYAGLSDEIYYYYPSSIKKRLTGDGKAEKKAVCEAVQNNLAEMFEFGSYDESDAAAVALCFIRDRFEKEIKLKC
jgi:crossover junction endodeoxyribonuclease RuvC